MFSWLKKAEIPLTIAEFEIQREDIAVDSFVELLTSTKILIEIWNSFLKTDRYKVPIEDFWINKTSVWGGRKQVLDAMVEDVMGEHSLFFAGKDYSFTTKVKVKLYSFLESWMETLLNLQFQKLRFRELELEKKIHILKERERLNLAQIEFFRKEFLTKKEDSDV